jgi:hypothetical protein
MSLVVLQSKGNGTPTRFNCSFPNGIILEPNSQVCCMSWSAKRSGFDEDIAINSYNDTLCWTFQDCENTAKNFPNVPFEKLSVSHGIWDKYSYADIASRLQLEMNDKEVLSAFKGGWVWKFTNNKFSVAPNAMTHLPMDKGLWRQYYGKGNPTIVNSPAAVPIKSVAAMSPGDISMNYIVNQSPTTQLIPGQINNTNGAPGQPIDAATVMGINTTDLNGVNQAVVLANMVGRYVTCVSTDTTTPGRNSTYAFIKILGVQTYVPAAPSPISAADIIQFDIQVIEQNLNIPNPPYNGMPFNWFMTEQLTLIFNGLSDPNAHTISPDAEALNFYDNDVLFNTSTLNSPSTGNVTDPSGYSFSFPITNAEPLSKMEGIVAGFVTNQYFQYTEGTDNTRNPDMDWSNRGGSNRAKVAFGFTIGPNWRLKALVGEENQDQFSQTNYSQEEIDISGINLTADRDTLDVVIRPIYNSTTLLHGWELLYRFKVANPYVVGHSVYALKSKTPFLTQLPLRQVLSYKTAEQMPANVKAIHNADAVTNLPATHPKWNMGFSISSQESFPTVQSDWLTFINSNATIGDSLNFYQGNYQVTGAGDITAEQSSLTEHELGNKPLLIQSPDLNVTGYCGVNGQTPQILQMCSGVNRLLMTQTLLYEQFTNNNWIELKNKTPLNLTRLGIVITDVENKEVNFLEDTVVCLKFRTNNQNIKLGGF